MTGYSAIAKPVILPVKNERTFKVDRNHHQYTFSYEGPNKYQRKVFYLMLQRHNRKIDIIKCGKNLDDLANIELMDGQPEGGPDKTQKVLAFREFPSGGLKVHRVHCKKILLMEFEAHYNISENDLPTKPTFVNYNPLFDKQGIKLVSIGEFEADWL